MSEKLTQRAGQYRFPVYVREADEDLVKDFIDKCKRNNSSASREILEFIRSQMPHREVTESESYVCYVKDCKEKATVQAKFVSQKILWACVKHYKEAFDKGLVRVKMKQL